MSQINWVQNLRDSARDTLFNEGFQLSLAQMDLFKTLSTLIIGLAAISYIYEKSSNVDYWSLFFSWTFGILVLILTISWSRETIDLHSLENEKRVLDMQEKTLKIQQKWLEASRWKNIQIFNNFIEEELSKPKMKKWIPNYIGEFMVFLFYNAFGFLILAFLLPLIPSAHCYPKVVFYIWIIFLTWLLSFIDWYQKILTMIINPLCHKILGKIPR